MDRWRFNFSQLIVVDKSPSIRTLKLMLERGLAGRVLLELEPSFFQLCSGKKVALLEPHLRSLTRKEQTERESGIKGPLMINGPFYA